MYHHSHLYEEIQEQNKARREERVYDLVIYSFLTIAIVGAIISFLHNIR